MATKYKASYLLKRPYGTHFYAALVIDTTIPKGWGSRMKQNWAYSGSPVHNTQEQAIAEAEAKIVELSQ